MSLSTNSPAVAVTPITRLFLLSFFFPIPVDSIASFTSYQLSVPLSSVLFRSLAVLDPSVGHTMDVLSPFISVLCHSD